jgi:hypothetical protein
VLRLCEDAPGDCGWLGYRRVRIRPHAAQSDATDSLQTQIVEGTGAGSASGPEESSSDPANHSGPRLSPFGVVALGLIGALAVALFLMPEIAEFSAGIFPDRHARQNRSHDQAHRPEPDSTSILSSRAEQGDPKAQYALAHMLLEGRGGLGEDPDRARVWFEKAALQGMPESQFYLGLLYHTGIGTPASRKLALHWFREAAEQGDSDALAYLERIGESAKRSLLDNNHSSAPTEIENSSADAEAEATAYDILAVSPEATLKEVKEAYLVKLKQYRADLTANPVPELRKLAADRIKAVKLAYDELLHKLGDG